MKSRILLLIIGITLFSHTAFGQITSGTHSIGSGLDYDTVTLFIADLGGTLTGNLTGEHANEETTISTDVVFDTDTATFLFKLTAASGAEHNGTFGSDTWTSGDGARIKYTTSDSLTLDETTEGHLDDVEISNLVLDCRGDQNDGVFLFDGSGSGRFTVNRCVIRGDGSADVAIRIWADTAPRLSIINNIIYDWSGGASLDGAITTGRNTVAVDDWEILNNTITGCRAGYEQLDTTLSSGFDLLLKNNLFQNNTTDYSEADTSLPAGYVTAKNVTEDNTSPDGAPYVSVDMHTTNDVFKNFGADDFRLDSGGHAGNLAILDDGEDLSGTFTDDIEGQTRDTWYIGASEIVAVGGEETQVIIISKLMERLLKPITDLYRWN